MKSCGTGTLACAAFTPAISSDPRSSALIFGRGFPNHQITAIPILLFFSLWRLTMWIALACDRGLCVAPALLPVLLDQFQFRRRHSENKIGR
jgi:hypothetical protein